MAALLTHVGQRGERLRMIRLQREHALQRLFRIGVSALLHQERGEIGVDARVVRGKPCRFPKACLGAFEVAYPLLRQGALHPDRRREITPDRSASCVQLRRFGEACRMGQHVGEIEYRVRVIRFALEDRAVAGLCAIGCADRRECEPQVVEHGGVTGRPLQGALVVGDGAGVVAAVSTAVAAMEQRFWLVRIAADCVSAMVAGCGRRAPMFFPDLLHGGFEVAGIAVHVEQRHPAPILGEPRPQRRKALGLRGQR